MSGILEIFGQSTKTAENVCWRELVRKQYCPYLERKCIKVRKSRPNTAIGTCSVLYGQEELDIIICPHRLLERKQVFMDAVHLLD